MREDEKSLSGSRFHKTETELTILARRHSLNKMVADCYSHPAVMTRVESNLLLKVTHKRGIYHLALKGSAWCGYATHIVLPIGLDLHSKAGSFCTS